ncbi:hypothetical protein TSUD_272520 [Trifolium subterraneum]|uniref:Reverse transcriptase zinc-binding domain-containing protein n=1 Tax=Trifolium subterraneum TaxID=3900 RepID=A0A2Z6NAA6_TRISU|nr:hypothetical protein TSUD_272520 [Trifolium subterraneum]
MEFGVLSEKKKRRFRSEGCKRYENLRLLAKWIIQGGSALWKDILVAKYVERILYEVELRDTCAIEKVVEDRIWFSKALVPKVGNRGNTRLWLDIVG